LTTSFLLFKGAECAGILPASPYGVNPRRWVIGPVSGRRRSNGGVGPVGSQILAALLLGLGAHRADVSDRGTGQELEKLFHNCGTGILPVIEHGQACPERSRRDGRVTKRPAGFETASWGALYRELIVFKEVFTVF
jgi:hypothetical protein